MMIMMVMMMVMLMMLLMMMMMDVMNVQCEILCDQVLAPLADAGEFDIFPIVR